MDLGEYYKIVSDILRGLEFLHAKKIIHRDIKAGNSQSPNYFLEKLIEVLRRRDGTWVLGDFGISVERLSGRLRPSRRGRASLETCAPEMMKPERFHNERLDIWAVGCVAHYLATGSQLFSHVSDFAQLANLFVGLTQDQVPSISNNAKLLINLDLKHRTETLIPDKVLSPILTSALQVDFNMRATATELLALTRSLMLPLTPGLTWPRCLPTTSDFVGRKATMKAIYNGFEKNSTILLHGFPGVGKTAIAAEYVLLNRDKYHRVAYLQYPFQDDSLEQMFELLTERSKGDPGSQPLCIPSIAPWLHFYNKGLIVIDLGHTLRLSRSILNLINALLALKQPKVRILLVSCRSKLYGCPHLQKVVRIKVPNLAINTAQEYARRVRGSQWSAPKLFSKITQYGFSRPAIFKHILESGTNLSEILAATQRLKQDATLGQPVHGAILDKVLRHPSFKQTIAGIPRDCAIKLLILSYLCHHHIDTELAETLVENWVREYSGHSISSQDDGGMKINLLTKEDLRRWERFSIIEWYTASEIAFSLDPYVQLAIFYKYCSVDANLGRQLWENTRSGLESYGDTLESEDFGISFSAHVERIVESRPSLVDGGMKFVSECSFPNLWEAYKEARRFILPERETRRRIRGEKSQTSRQ